jgi:hypothetical protein
VKEKREARNEKMQRDKDEEEERMETNGRGEEE